MSGRTDSNISTVAVDVAKKSGLVDLLKKRTSSSSNVNETVTSESIFKVPQVPVSNSQPKQNLQSNFISDRVVDVGSKCKNALDNILNNMHRHNENALLALFSSVLYQFTEFLQSEYETSFSVNMSTCNDVTMERSTISSIMNCRSAVQRNECNMKNQMQPYVSLHNNNCLQHTCVTGRMESGRSAASSNMSFRRILQPNKNDNENRLQPRVNLRNTNASQSSNNTSLRRGISEWQMKCDPYSRNARSVKHNNGQASSNLSECHSDESVASEDSELHKSVFSSGIFGDEDSMIGNKRPLRKRSDDSILNDTFTAFNSKKKKSNMNDSIFRKNSRPSFSIPFNKRFPIIDQKYTSQKIKNWFLRRKDGTKSIEIVGYPVSGRGGKCLVAVVNSRINSYTIKTNIGVVHLEGSINSRSGMDPRLKASFVHGFPLHWRKVINTIDF